MDATSSETDRSSSRLQHYIAVIWYTLRSPKLTVTLVASLGVVLILGFLMPQQSTLQPDPAIWISTLPWPVQLWGEPLFFLGFAWIFRSVWFWLPVALILLNSLVALADYGPGTWQRMGNTTPPIDWQHPLAQRTEQIVRLPESPDKYLDQLQTAIKDSGFALYETEETEQRTIGAAQRRWSWTGVIVVYIGLILLCTAVLTSYYFYKLDRFTLFPLEAKASSMFEGQFELIQIDSSQEAARVNFATNETGQSKRALTWQLYMPTLVDYALILPIAVEPILSIEARDSKDTQLKLIPVQEDLPPSERLNLPFGRTTDPLYFLIPSVKLAVQVLPNPTSRESLNVQIRRDSEATSPENFEVQMGKAFEVDEDLFVTMSLEHNLRVLAYRDPALPLYVISIILIVVGGLLSLVRPPVLLWLIWEVRGRGGQLYGVLEKLGAIKHGAQYLEQLLAVEVEQEHNNENTGESESSG